MKNSGSCDASATSTSEPPILKNQKDAEQDIDHQSRKSAELVISLQAEGNEKESENICCGEIPFWAFIIANNAILTSIVAVFFSMLSAPFTWFLLLFEEFNLEKLISFYEEVIKGKANPKVVYAMLSYVLHWIGILLLLIPSLMNFTWDNFKSFEGEQPFSNKIDGNTYKIDGNTYKIDGNTYKLFSLYLYGLIESILVVCVFVLILLELFYSLVFKTYRPLSSYRYLHIFLYNEELDYSYYGTKRLNLVDGFFLFVMSMWYILPVINVLSAGIILGLHLTAKQWYDLFLFLYYVIIYKFCVIRMALFIHIIWPLILILRILTCCIYVESWSDLEFFTLHMWPRFEN